jgi:hypothetical protein
MKNSEDEHLVLKALNLYAQSFLRKVDQARMLRGRNPDGVCPPMDCRCAICVRLVATLKRGDIVVADNVSFHKVASVEAAIRGVGASLRYLPQYSTLTLSSWCSIPRRLSYARLPSAQSKGCTDVSDRSFGQSILLNA